MSEKRQRVPGYGKGKIWIADDFDAPLPAEILATLEESIVPLARRASAPSDASGNPTPNAKNARGC